MVFRTTFQMIRILLAMTIMMTISTHAFRVVQQFTPSSLLLPFSIRPNDLRYGPRIQQTHTITTTLLGMTELKQRQQGGEGGGGERDELSTTTTTNPTSQHQHHHHHHHTTPFVPPIHETEDVATDMLQQAYECAKNPDATLEECTFYLHQVLEIQSGCVTGTLVGHELCDVDPQHMIQLVTTLQDKIHRLTPTSAGVAISGYVNKNDGGNDSIYIIYTLLFGCKCEMTMV